MLADAEGPTGWSILVHGAGDIAPEDTRLPPKVARKRPRRAQRSSPPVIRRSNAVVAAVMELEPHPLFNSGTGACLDEAALIRHDTSVMDGETLAAGGVCAMPALEHPIGIVRKVMDDSPHVLLTAEGAVRFGLSQGFVRGKPCCKNRPRTFRC